MSSDLSHPINPTPQAPQPEPNGPHSAEPRPNKLKGGCAGCLVIVFALLLAVYILIFQTSIPLKLIAGSLENGHVADGRKLQINGVGGSLSRGVKIREIIIPGENGDSTIKDLRFRYKKPLRMFTRGQFILTEVSTGSAEFIVSNDFFESDEADPEADDWELEDEPETDSMGSEGFFELRLLKLQNTRLRSVDGSIDVNIPLIHMKGLRSEHDNFKIEEFEIKSSVLDASLSKGGTVELDGRRISFDHRINITVKPEIHESVIKDITASYEFKKNKGRSITHITAFDGAMDQIDFDSDSNLVRINSLQLQDYLKFEDHLMPATVNLTSRQQGTVVKLEPGSFSIGQTTFQFDGREFDESEEETLTGVTSVGPYEITAHLRPEKEDNGWPPLHVELHSKPEAAKEEILAHLYHGKPYASLTDEEKTAIDKLK